MNSMKNLRIAKVTLNVGAGKSQDRLDKGIKLIKMLTGIEPVKTVTQKRLAAWGLRPGLPIGCKVTLRGEPAKSIMKRMLEARDNKLTYSHSDNEVKVAFGLHEYIDIPEARYDPEIGIMGLQLCATIERPGYRIKNRKLRQKSVPAKHRIKKEEVIEFLKKEFEVKFEEEESA